VAIPARTPPVPCTGCRYFCVSTWRFRRCRPRFGGGGGERGTLPTGRTWLDGWYDKSASRFPQAIHYASGSPWLAECQNVDYGDEWRASARELGWMPPLTPMSQAYRPEIDGLRTVAVLPVIWYHAGMPDFPGGFIGVDVFGVHSGYPITGFLVNESAQGRYCIARFSERRARRSLPALCVVLIASIIGALCILLPSQFMDFSASIFAMALFLSNMLFLAEVEHPEASRRPSCRRARAHH